MTGGTTIRSARSARLSSRRPSSASIRRVAVPVASPKPVGSRSATVIFDPSPSMRGSSAPTTGKPLTRTVNRSTSNANSRPPGPACSFWRRPPCHRTIGAEPATGISTRALPFPAV
ncbi:unannotated protein [freshwater metagenome]|uniref:Unannotated protein n=1 Tax=freshwater metagenome TaxID=449393 RepID=A0A6J7L372_9ZZZZ